MKTLYVSDLDGTLLRTNQKTSDFTNKIINELVEEGLLFSYATARSYNTSHKVTEGMTADFPLIVYNGVFVRDNASGEMLLKNFFDEEIKEVVDYTICQQKARYDARFEHAGEEDTTTMVEGDVSHDTSDPMYKEIVEFVVTKGAASASLLQRRFHIGYNRAATYIDLLEERGIIGPQNGSKPREVIYKLENNSEDE